MCRIDTCEVLYTCESFEKYINTLLQVFLNKARRVQLLYSVHLMQ